MTAFALALPLFVLERAHQWQALAAADWAPRGSGLATSRRAVILVALAIGWAEGLGFYVQSQRAFWAMTFWVLVGHVLVTQAGWLRRVGGRVRWAGFVLAAIAVAATMTTFGAATDDATPSWLGHALVPAPPRGAATIACAAAFLGAIALVARRRCVDRVAIAVGGTTGAALALHLQTTFDGAAALVVFVVAVHALPCFVTNLRAVPRGARARTAALGLSCAALEWWLVAKSVWFPPDCFFPDLVDWWDLGPDAHFLLHPVWMAPFLAHAVVDAFRSFRPVGPPP